MSPDYASIYEVVENIPRGRVATYGQVAALAGLPRRARQVGYALHALPPGNTIPWHRVVNAKGEVSARSDGDGDLEQRARLESEGVQFNARGRIDLRQFRWLISAQDPVDPL